MTDEQPKVTSEEEAEQELLYEIAEQSHLPLLMALGDLEMVRDEIRTGIRTLTRHMNSASNRQSPLTVADMLQISEQTFNVIMNRLAREVRLLDEIGNAVQAKYGAPAPGEAPEECATCGGDEYVQPCNDCGEGKVGQ